MKLKFLPFLSLLLLAGCDSAAIQFARQTRALLNEYQKNINDQIGDSVKYYNNDASIAASAAAQQLEGGFGIDRDERATELAADYLEGRKPFSRYRTDIRTYAQVEYETRKLKLEAAVDAGLPYQQQLSRLEANKEMIEAIGKALDALEQKRSLKTEAEDLKGFVTETKTHFSLLVCTDLKTKKGVLDVKTATETGAQKASDQEQSAALGQLRSDRKCDDIEKASAK